MKKHKTKYHIEKDGDWIKPKMRDYRLECCDCGLVHKLDFIVVDEETDKLLNGVRVVFRAYRESKE